MIKVIEVGISILLLMSGVKVGEFYGSSLLEVHLSNGNIFNIKTDRSNSYSCPINCKAIHHHSTVVGKNNNNKNYVINYLNNEMPLKLNNYKIAAIYEIKDDKKKNKKNKRQRIKVDLQSFIRKYNL